MTMHQKYVNLGIDGAAIGLEQPDCGVEQFCTPRGIRSIGWEGNIQYGFIRGYGEMVFAVNPEGGEGSYVRPLAANFRDFLRLILACGSVTAVEQITGWTEEQFLEFLRTDPPYPERQKVLEKIQSELHLLPMEKPYQYVKAVQAQTDLGRIKFSDEYYDVLGLALPSGRKRQEPQWVETVEVKVYRKIP